LFFGARRVPELARALGRGKREFHRGALEGDGETEAEEPGKTEARQDKQESPPPERIHSEERSVP
jgi:Sec-independent protein translocase protein TatA